MSQIVFMSDGFISCFYYRSRLFNALYISWLSVHPIDEIRIFLPYSVVVCCFCSSIFFLDVLTLRLRPQRSKERRWLISKPTSIVCILNQCFLPSFFSLLLIPAQHFQSTKCISVDFLVWLDIRYAVSFVHQKHRTKPSPMIYCQNFWSFQMHTHGSNASRAT